MQDVSAGESKSPFDVPFDIDICGGRCLFFLFLSVCVLYNSSTTRCHVDIFDLNEAIDARN